MSIDDPPGSGVPQPNRIEDYASGDAPREDNADGNDPRGPAHSSAVQIMETAHSALNTVMENGATLL